MSLASPPSGASDTAIRATSPSDSTPSEKEPLEKDSSEEELPAEGVLDHEPSDKVHPSLDDEYHIPNRNTPRYNLHPVGIDTARFLVEEFTVCPTAELTIDNPTNAGTGEVGRDPLYRSGNNGDIVEGKVAKYNHDSFQVRIYGPTALSLQVNLPKMLGRDNVLPVHTPSQFDRAITQLETLLRRSGIEANVAGSTITRLDICRNIRTESQLTDYRRLLEEITFPHTEQTFYGNGNARWRNGERQVQLYDKSEESGLGTNRIQRLEYRLTSARSIRRHVGPGEAAELRKDFSAVQSAFEAAVRTLIPNSEASKLDDPKSEETSGPDTDSKHPVVVRRAIESAFDELSERSRQTKDVVLALGIHSLRASGSVEAFLETLCEIKGRQAEARYRKKFEELGPAADIFSEQTRTVTDMAKELRTKLLPIRKSTSK